MEKVLGYIVGVLGIIGLSALVIVLFTWPVQLMWNASIPRLFHGPELRFIDTLYLLVLSKIFFKSSFTNSKKED